MNNIILLSQLKRLKRRHRFGATKTSPHLPALPHAIVPLPHGATSLAPMIPYRSPCNHRNLRRSAFPLHSSRGGSNRACSNHACDPWTGREERRQHREGVHLHPRQQELLIAAVAQERRQVHRAVAAGVVWLSGKEDGAASTSSSPHERPSTSSRQQ